MRTVGKKGTCITKDIMKHRFCLHKKLETHPYMKTEKKTIIPKREKERHKGNGKQCNERFVIARDNVAPSQNID